MSTYTMRQKPQFLQAGDQRLVVLDAADWEQLVTRLEEREDDEDISDAVTELRLAEGDPSKAGWLKWDELAKQENG